MAEMKINDVKKRLAELEIQEEKLAAEKKVLKSAVQEYMKQKDLNSFELSEGLEYVFVEKETVEYSTEVLIQFFEVDRVLAMSKPQVSLVKQAKASLTPAQQEKMEMMADKKNTRYLRLKRKKSKK